MKGRSIFGTNLGRNCRELLRVGHAATRLSRSSGFFPFAYQRPSTFTIAGGPTSSPSLTMSNPKPEFDIWEFVSCAKCHLPFSADPAAPPLVPFWLTSCGHVLCNNHISLSPSSLAQEFVDSSRLFVIRLESKLCNMRRAARSDGPTSERGTRWLSVQVSVLL